MGSFAKRARALVIFTGLVPFTAAQAQTAPECKFELKISKTAAAEGNLFTVDSDPTVQGRYSLQVQASKVKPNAKELLVFPSAALSAAYRWTPGNPLSSYDLEVRNPYTVEGDGTGPTFASNLTIEGLTENFSMETYAFANWETLVDSNAADKFGALKKDVTLTLGPPDGDADGKSYVFSFAKGDITKAYKAAPAQLAALIKQQQAGKCQPSHQTTTSSSGSSGGCFLTTAACEGIGLADDCWELRTLRKFRDGWLAGQAGGTDDIKAYYAKAPAIAERLKSDPKALLRLYWTRIVPSALAAQFGLNKAARAIYAAGMRELAEG